MGAELGLERFLAPFLGQFGGGGGARRATDRPAFRLFGGLLLLTGRSGNLAIVTTASMGIRVKYPCQRPVLI